MQPEITSLSSDELVLLFHQINRELRKNLINGAPLNQQQEKIGMLTEISKELSRRKIEFHRSDASANQGQK